ncbi:MAG: 16S rRNA (guanine(966)-N(2))-methyltransferase RsmD [Acidaminococcaceae bacterium]|nr:16S rRNA (guanine(966)-N(2))-methyltransferase RsmD [Acidaminococcaceae bacterium]
MRIITGKARGLHLNVPKNYDVRPTADRVKESLFNIIGSKIVDAAVLDLFAGSGNLGLESWSRGAQLVQFVDNSRVSLRLTESNIQKCRAEAECKVLKHDAEAAVDLLYKQGQRFDLVFVDPPYNKGWVQKILVKLEKNPILAESGWLVAEHSMHDDIAIAVSDGYEIFRRQQYGETVLTFIRRKMPSHGLEDVSCNE